MEEPKPGEKYVHFRGDDKVYEIVTIVRSSENPEEKDVIYRQLYDAPGFPKGTGWRRSLARFCETVDFKGTKVPRFRRI